MKESPVRTLISLIPVLVLITLLAVNIGIFGSDAILGASQVALLASAGVCVLLATTLFKTPWKEFEKTSPARHSSSFSLARYRAPGP